jgi:hypothetical protein
VVVYLTNFIRRRRCPMGGLSTILEWPARSPGRMPRRM